MGTANRMRWDKTEGCLSVVMRVVRRPELPAVDPIQNIVGKERQICMIIKP